jgi:hypothetical protein
MANFIFRGLDFSGLDWTAGLSRTWQPDPLGKVDLIFCQQQALFQQGVPTLDGADRGHCAYLLKPIPADGRTDLGEATSPGDREGVALRQELLPVEGVLGPQEGQLG